MDKCTGMDRLIDMYMYMDLDCVCVCVEREEEWRDINSFHCLFPFVCSLVIHLHVSIHLSIYPHQQSLYQQELQRREKVSAKLDKTRERAALSRTRLRLV